MPGGSSSGNQPQTRSAVAAEADTHLEQFMNQLHVPGQGGDGDGGGLGPGPTLSAFVAPCAGSDPAVAASPGAPCGTVVNTCH